ncbi:MAG: alcohol dehydrogenase catalytic domain-containing protein [Chloroflexi bacterium]|nr:alcohol dehydrogenase catalytic domain-containing protein [Chloroflexota bacterium]
MAIPTTMRAAVLYGQNDLRVQDYPVPIPGPLEVLLKVYACAICGTDPRLIGHGWNPMPNYGIFIPGHEYSGQIVAVGEGVTQFQAGDRVAIESHKGCGHCINCKRGRYTICLNYGKPETGHRHYGFTTNGGYAQYVVNHISNLYKIADSVSYEEAALITTAACVHFALDNVGGLMGGETVAVLGPGPIGLMAVQLVKALGASKVILTGTRDDRLAMGKRLGADVVVNVNNQDPVQVVKNETGGLGAELIVECSGHPVAAAQAIEMAMRGARISFVGDPVEMPRINLKKFVLDDLRAAGVRGEGMADCGRSLALLGSGKICAKPLITHHFSLEQINEGFQTFIQRKGGALKVIIQPNGDE